MPSIAQMGVIFSYILCMMTHVTPASGSVLGMRAFFLSGEAQQAGKFDELQEDQGP